MNPPFPARNFLLSVVLGCAIVVGGCANVPATSDAQVLLAPTGTLRAALVLTSAVQVNQNSVQSDRLDGVAPTLGRELARRLGVPFEAVRYATAAELTASVVTDAWDVAFLGYDPDRATQLAFTKPYMEAGLTYLVPARSDIRSIADADRSGVRIAVIAKSPSDLFLSRSLKYAEVVRGTAGPDSAFALLAAGQADAFAASPDLLVRYTRRLPEASILDGNFATLQQAIAVRRKHESALNFVDAFLYDAKKSGLVAEAIARAGLRGVSVTPELLAR